ncbi:MAG: glycoside hydrolase family 43 protein [Dysgonamonadaceae bacterium]|jgi:hypothetical protein|nr:glycoside hydrolase family 43 protein [Dysgonamonadaceae bacterium]
MNRKHFFFLALAVCGISAAFAQQPNPPGQVKSGEKALNEAYLFAHMTHQDYGRLYYSVSTDGLHWEALNGGKRVFDDYHGHPDICKGHDGRYYMTGNQSDSDPDIQIWVSDDLIIWKKFGIYTPNLHSTPDYANAMQRIGAPKLYYDESTAQYILTWHTTHPLEEAREIPEPYWAGQRTLYALSKDLKTFSATPSRLFDWSMATIDVFVRKVGDTYYAIIKDERYPTLHWTTGKTIRIASAPKLTGPYSEPSAPVSPNFREAPMLIPSPDSKVWYLYYEQYPGVAYGLSIAENLNGPWYQASGYTHSDWDKYSLPPSVRHGCMITISKAQYDALVNHYGINK